MRAGSTFADLRFQATPSSAKQQSRTSGCTFKASYSCPFQELSGMTCTDCSKMPHTCLGILLRPLRREALDVLSQATDIQLEPVIHAMTCFKIFACLGWVFQEIGLKD